MANQEAVEALIEIIGNENLSYLAQKMDESLQKAERAAQKTAKGTDDISDALDDSTTRAAILVSGFDSLVNIAGDAAAAVSEIGAAMAEVGRRQDQAAAFARQFGNEAENTLQRLRSASSNEFTDQFLRTAAQNAREAGVSMKDLGDVMDTSLRIARARGIEATDVFEKLFNDVILGASDSALEDFGIIFDLPEAAKKFGAEMGLTSDQVDKTVESMAALKFVTGDVAERFKNIDLNATATGAIAELDAAIENLKQAAAEELGPSLVILANASRDTVAGLTTLESQFALLFKTANDLTRQTGQFAEAQSKATDEVKLAAEARQRHADRIRDAVVALHNEREAAISNALEMAEQAKQMGFATIAVDKYREALELSEKAGKSFNHQQRIRRKLQRELNKEFITTLQIQADMLEVEIRMAGGALNDQLPRLQTILDRITDLRRGLSESVSEALKVAPDARGGGGRGGRGGRSNPYTNTDDEINGVWLPSGAAASGAGLFERGEAFDTARGFASELGGPGPEKAVDSFERLASTMDKVTSALLSTRDAWSAFADVAFDADIGEQFQQAIPQIGQLTQAIGKLASTDEATTTQMVQGAGQIAQSSAQLTASFVSDQAVKYGILGAGEVAAALASYPDYVGMAIHGAAAAAYFAAAGMAGSGGGGGARAAAAGSRRPNIPAAAAPVNQPPDSGDRGGVTIIVPMDGAVIFGEDREKVGRFVADSYEQEMRRRGRSDGRGFLPR